MSANRTEEVNVSIFDEQCFFKARAEAIQNCINEQSKRPVNIEEAYKWQHNRFCEECATA